MTVNDLGSAIDLLHELAADGHLSCVAYVYKRRTGQTLFAVFPDIGEADLKNNPEIECYAQIGYIRVN